jgi:CMP-N,N'-diacetyllegionaminic acid synthase
MRILALITARGGSKRIPRKNIRPLGGIPLINWSIEVVRGLAQICDTMVSTDDAEIAEIARGSGALVPWLRPSILATDSSGSVDVCVHALDWYEGHNGAVDGLLLLQPTSPLRRRDSVKRGLALFQEQGQTVLGFAKAPSHPAWCFHLVDGAMRPVLGEGAPVPRSQDLPPNYVVNGAFYLIAPTILRMERSFYGPSSVVPLIFERPEESIDIDTEWDWMVAEAAIVASKGRR